MTESIQFVMGFYFRTLFLPFKGMSCAQHQHDVSHPTYCGSGKARLYVDGKFECDVEAGNAVAVQAGRKHFFEALEDNTRLACVFDSEQEQELKRKGY